MTEPDRWSDEWLGTARCLIGGEWVRPAGDTHPVVDKQRQRVRAFVRDAEERGARRLDGKAPDLPSTGFFEAPAVFADVPAGTRALREEVFGPVLVVQSYQDEADAARLANDTDYGLSAEVWSADPDRARAFGRGLRVGQVKINGVRTREYPATPFGGFKQSGFGRELGPLGLLEMTTVTAVMG